MSRNVMWLLIAALSQTVFTTAMNCPGRCTCIWILDSLKIDCSKLDLINTPNFADLPVEILDLSGNRFTNFPNELSLVESLISLDLSNNFIQDLPADTFIGYRNLRQLFLRNNNITNWSDLNPNHVLTNAMNLQTLSLAGNPLQSFSSNDTNLVLMSSSLTTLDLSFCKIRKIAGNFALQGLDRLENLILNGNMIQTIGKLESQSLKMLDLSNCAFRNLDPNTLIGLPNLFELDLSRNSLLSLDQNFNQYPQSRSLRRLNLSFCNMPSINLQGFPNVTMVILRGNMIREVTETSFRVNGQIESLDLSYNAIGYLDLNAFSSLRYLKRLDLSYNMIATVNRNTFTNNEILTSLNLSRNILTKFNRISGTSILNFDLSSCEITTIDSDALHDMPIVELNLSNNLISAIPNGFLSETLQTLDLSLNRISTINNNTFLLFPELSKINLSGNRFTMPFRSEYFRKNQYLHDIMLEDNPWRCDCNDKAFKQFFLYLSQTPAKVISTKRLKCTSPENVSGRSWEHVCFATWFPRNNMSSVEKFWTVLMTCLLVICLCLITYRITMKYMKKKKQQRNDSERRDNVEDQLRIQQYNRNILAQAGQQNAPDPRESNPPSYEVALLMPPLKRLTKSFIDITVKESNENLDQPDSSRCPNPRSHYHSDNALLRPDEDRTAHIRRTPSFRRQSPRTRRISRLVAVRPPRCPDPNMKASESVGKISNFQCFENSPYTRRKPRSTTTSSISRSSSLIDDIHGEGPSTVPLRNDSLNFIENYYIRPKSISNSGDEYEMVSSDDDYGSKRTSIRSSNGSDKIGLVVVHSELKESPL